VGAEASQVGHQRRHRQVALFGVGGRGFGDDGAPLRGTRRWRLHAGNQLVQHATQAVDVAGAGGRGACDLLGAGVVRRQRGGAGLLLALQARDAEVQQHGAPVAIDEHVAGLDVAVHDELAVRVADGFADHREQVQHGVQAQLVFAAPGVYGPALDVLHHQVGPAARRGATVDQARDVRVRQARKDAALGRQLRQRHLAGQAQQQLDRGALLVVAVAALGQEDAAHAAVAQFPAQRPGAQAVAGREFGGRGSRDGTRQHARHRGAEARLAALAAGQQRQHAGGQGRRHLQGLNAFLAGAVAIDLGQLGEERLGLRVVGIGVCRRVCHARAQASSSRPRRSTSQARAKRSSRSTVGTDSPSTSAMAARSRPAK
jgi:hypothetical protein